VCEIVDIAAA